jgi:hypothetical protein
VIIATGTPITVLASTGTPTAAEMPEIIQTLKPHEFSRKFRGKLDRWRKFSEKNKDRVKIVLFVRQISVSPTAKY